MQRPFYIIGHNPNTLEEVVAYLNKGANALEPDIHWDEEAKRFRVCHTSPDETDIFLEDYLEGLKKILRGSTIPHELAFVSFDLKPDYTYDLAGLYGIIRTHFSSAFPEVMISTTVASANDMDFLLAMKDKQLRNEAVGVDEGAHAADVVARFAPTGMNYTYAKGISLFEFEPFDSWIGPKSFVDAVREGTELREQHGTGLSLVYGWCINSKSDMKRYLSMDPPVDGILTDQPEILFKLLQEEEFKEKYCLAKPGYNPFILTRKAINAT